MDGRRTLKWLDGWPADMVSHQRSDSESGSHRYDDDDDDCRCL